MFRCFDDIFAMDSAVVGGLIVYDAVVCSVYSADGMCGCVLAG